MNALKKGLKKLMPAGHKRINEQLLDYWTQKKGDRAYPLEGEIDPSEIMDIWDSCFLVKSLANEEGGEYKYTYLGQSLVEAYGDDLNNKEICEKLIYPTNMSLIHKFDEVVSKAQPADEDGEFTNTKGMLIKFRSVMMPLGKEGADGVQYVIGGMKWKAF